MSVEPSELVVVLGPETSTVLDVGTAAEVLSHITMHVVNHAAGPPPSRPARDLGHLDRLARPDELDELDPLVRDHRHGRSTTLRDPRPVHVPAPEPLRFYRALDGELLHLRLMSDWWTFDLEPAGTSIGADGLEAEVHAVFARAAGGVQAVLAEQHLQTPQLPPPGTWAEQLDEIRDLVAGPSRHHDRRGWAHNFFVHGWT